MRSRTARGLLALFVLGAGVALALAVVLKRGGGGELTVTAAGKTVRLKAGTTLGQAASELALEPRAGNLLDVEGGVLRRNAIPGALLLDGNAATAGARLRDGDRIAVVAGRDRQRDRRPRSDLARAGLGAVLPRPSAAAAGACGGAHLRRRSLAPVHAQNRRHAATATRPRHLLRDRLPRRRVSRPDPAGAAGRDDRRKPQRQPP